MSDDNLRKIVKILTSQGYRVKQPVDPMGIADPKTRQGWIENKHMKAFNFYKDEQFKEVDIIIDSPVRFPQAVKTAKIKKIGDIRVPLISIDNLIKMKKRAGRVVDLGDLERLRHLKRLKK